MVVFHAMFPYWIRISPHSVRICLHRRAVPVRPFPLGLMKFLPRAVLQSLCLVLRLNNSSATQRERYGCVGPLAASAS